MWLRRAESAFASLRRDRSASPEAALLRRDGSAPAPPGRNRRLWHSFTFRLSFYYASAFVISAALLFALLYFLQATFFD
jgi:hypothetical protein